MAGSGEEKRRTEKTLEEKVCFLTSVGISGSWIFIVANEKLFVCKREFILVGSGTNAANRMEEKLFERSFKKHFPKFKVGPKYKSIVWNEAFYQEVKKIRKSMLPIEKAMRSFFTDISRNCLVDHNILLDGLRGFMEELQSEIRFKERLDKLDEEVDNIDEAEAVKADEREEASEATRPGMRGC